MTATAVAALSHSTLICLLLLPTVNFCTVNLPYLCDHRCAVCVHCPQDPQVIRKLSERLPDIGRKMEYLLNTGARLYCCIRV
jgi:hypothetical protein